MNKTEQQSIQDLKGQFICGEITDSFALARVRDINPDLVSAFEAWLAE